MTDVICEDKFILLKSKELHQSLFNSIRRTLISHIPTLGFEEYIDPEDYALLNQTFQLKLSRQRHVVLDNNTCFSIPMVSHRLSRLPIFTSPETLGMLRLNDPDYRVFFTLADASGKPLMNKTNALVKLTARSLKPMLFRKKLKVIQEEDEAYETEEWLEQEHTIDVSRLFPYDTFLLDLAPGKKIHAIVSPVIGFGIDNPRWTPCVQRYRFNRDPEWQATHPIKTIIHKKENELSLRRQFSTKPPSKRTSSEPDTYDLFMKPYEVELMVIGNGKMAPGEALKTSLLVLLESLAHFSALIKTKDTFIEQTLDEGNNIARFVCPKDTYSTEAKDGANRIYTGHTLANILVSKMLQIVTRDIIQSDICLLEKVLIAYKIPHPLIQQVIYTIQLPTDEPIFQAKLGSPEQAAQVLLLKAADELMAEIQELHIHLN
jgi:DNA-directed RNA polymerase subunit L